MLSEVHEDGTGSPRKFLFTFKIFILHRLGHTEHSNSSAVNIMNVEAKSYVQTDRTSSLQYKGQTTSSSPMTHKRGRDM